MARRKLIVGGMIATLLLGSHEARAQGQTPPVAAVKARVGVGRIAGGVRGAKGGDGEGWDDVRVLGRNSPRNTKRFNRKRRE